MNDILQKIMISDKLDHSSVLSVNLLHILDALPSYKEKMNWIIYSLDLFPITKDEDKFKKFESVFGKRFIALTKEIDSYDCGLIVNWDKLRKFANILTDTYQPMFITLFGLEKNIDHRNCSSYKELLSISNILLECIDSSYWLVYSKDESIYGNFFKSFKNVEHCTDKPIEKW